MFMAPRLSIVVASVALAIVSTYGIWVSQQHAANATVDTLGRLGNRSTVQLSTAAVPDCGKICSYEYDRSEYGKFYPLLRKQVNCQNIFNRMINPPYKVVKPPPRHPPPNMVNDYTQNGECPIRYWPQYFDESGPSQSRYYNAQYFLNYLRKENVSNVNHYADKNIVQPTLTKYIEHITDKNVLVVGTQRPWAEAMLVNRGARKVTTAEYNYLTIEHPRIEIIKPHKLAERFSAGQAEQFDAAFSYSSFEHTGMGRYGDPLMPFGDLEAVAQVWCMMKPGGYLFLAVPVSDDRKECMYMWNAHRVYGKARLQHLTAN